MGPSHAATVTTTQHPIPTHARVTATPTLSSEPTDWTRVSFRLVVGSDLSRFQSAQAPPGATVGRASELVVPPLRCPTWSIAGHTQWRGSLTISPSSARDCRLPNDPTPAQLGIPMASLAHQEATGQAWGQPRQWRTSAL